MKIACKPIESLRNKERKKLDIYNREAKYLESATKMQVPTDFKDQLEEALNQICASVVDRESGGYVSQDIIKMEFEADYMIAYRFRSGQCDLIFSTDSDMSALCGPDCISICSFGENKKRKHGKGNVVRNLYNISGGSNKLMICFQSLLQK